MVPARLSTVTVSSLPLPFRLPVAREHKRSGDVERNERALTFERQGLRSRFLFALRLVLSFILFFLPRKTYNPSYLFFVVASLGKETLSVGIAECVRLGGVIHPPVDGAIYMVSVYK